MADVRLQGALAAGEFGQLGFQAVHVVRGGYVALDDVRVPGHNGRVTQGAAAGQGR
ncbi:hypothetical protein [Streptomyces sp. RB17]|uniref:hypothetical protein n=1 Tax=Streptomyces sp. RB17 TaxID=2585197 RepID=UPI0012961CC2|nr:hypothetical protein [Streptomyces sp. RB17]